MGYFIDAFRALKTTFGNIFRKPITAEFPAVIRPRAERYRASFALPDDEHGELACVGCLACERICPSQVIKMKATGKKESPVTGKKRQYVDEFTLDLSACIQCELCVQVCNSDAIFMVREPEQPAYAREDLVLTVDRLRENARKRTASWGRGTVLQEMQESKPKVEKPAAKAPAGAEGTKPAAPAVAKPAEEKPAETKPAETKPAETKPAETKPAEAKAAATKPADAKAPEARTSEAKPAETKPAETKPAEPRSTEAKAQEAKTPEAKPAEATPAEARAVGASAATTTERSAP